MLAWSCGSKRPTWTQPTFFPSSEQVVLWSVSGVKHLTAFSSSLAVEVFAQTHQVFYLTILVLLWINSSKQFLLPSLFYQKLVRFALLEYRSFSSPGWIDYSGHQLTSVKLPRATHGPNCSGAAGKLGRVQVTEARGLVLSGLEWRVQLPPPPRLPMKLTLFHKPGLLADEQVTKDSFSSWRKISSSTWQGGGESPIMRLVFRWALSLFLSSCVSSHPYLKPWWLPM